LISILKNSRSKSKGKKIQFKNEGNRVESQEVSINHHSNDLMSKPRGQGQTYNKNPYIVDNGNYITENKLTKDHYTYARNPSANDGYSNAKMPDFEYEFCKLPIYGPIFYPGGSNNYA
jgi:hypothetical protein